MFAVVLSSVVARLGIFLVLSEFLSQCVASLCASDAWSKEESVVPHDLSDKMFVVI